MRGLVPLGFFGDGARYVEHGDGKIYVLNWNGLLGEGTETKLQIKLLFTSATAVLEDTYSVSIPLADQ